jgi:hypothetical protein
VTRRADPAQGATASRSASAFVSAPGPAWQDTGLLFTREDGSAVHPDHVTDTFHRIAKAAGLRRSGCTISGTRPQAWR